METFWFFWLRFHRAYDSTNDSDFRFSQGRKLSYDSDSVASENQPSMSIATLKPWTNDRNSSTRHIAILLAQYLQAPAKRSQHFDATYRNIVGRNMLRAFDYHVGTCCGMLRVENRTNAHALAQHCCTNLAKRLQLQHHATSTNVASKIWPFSNLSQQHPTRRNMLRLTMLRGNVAIVWLGHYDMHAGYCTDIFRRKQMLTY